MSTATPDEPRDPRADADTELVPAVASDEVTDVTEVTEADEADDATQVLPEVAADEAPETAVLPVAASGTQVLPATDEADEADEAAADGTVADEPVDEAVDEPATAAFAAGAATTEAPRVPLDKPAGVPMDKAPRPSEPVRPTEPARPATAWAEAPAAAPARRRLRVSTVVWGLMLVAAGVWILAWASGARIDVQLALIVLLAAGGAALLVGSIISGARHSRR